MKSAKQKLMIVIKHLAMKNILLIINISSYYLLASF